MAITLAQYAAESEAGRKRLMRVKMRHLQTMARVWRCALGEHRYHRVPEKAYECWLIAEIRAILALPATSIVGGR